jgi:hypothetical protein
MTFVTVNFNTLEKYNSYRISKDKLHMNDTYIVQHHIRNTARALHQIAAPPSSKGKKPEAVTRNCHNNK